MIVYSRQIWPSSQQDPLHARSLAQQTSSMHVPSPRVSSQAPSVAAVVVGVSVVAAVVVVAALGSCAPPIHGRFFRYDASLRIVRAEVWEG